MYLSAITVLIFGMYRNTKISRKYRSKLADINISKGINKWMQNPYDFYFLPFQTFIFTNSYPNLKTRVDFIMAQLKNSTCNFGVSILSLFFAFFSQGLVATKEVLVSVATTPFTTHVIIPILVLLQLIPLRPRHAFYCLLFIPFFPKVWMPS